MRALMILLSVAALSFACPVDGAEPDRAGGADRKARMAARRAKLKAEGKARGGGRRAEGKTKRSRGITHADVAYGEHKDQILDLYLADSGKPTPLLVYMHGGGFRIGTHKSVKKVPIGKCLAAGISVASIEYRLTKIGHYPMQHHDCARAVQFLRYHAKKYNLDKTRFAATGGSAGSGLAQWLGFHDDLADPKAKDPIARESTRMTCVLPTNAQCTYDPRLIKEIVGGNTYAHIVYKKLLGVDPRFDWDKDKIPKEVLARIEDCGPITLLSKDDCPVYFLSYADAAEKGNPHHPNHGKYLEKEMKKTGLEYVIHLDTDFPVNGRTLHEDMVAWLEKHFKMGK